MDLDLDGTTDHYCIVWQWGLANSSTFGQTSRQPQKVAFVRLKSLGIEGFYDPKPGDDASSTVTAKCYGYAGGSFLIGQDGQLVQGTIWSGSSANTVTGRWENDAGLLRLHGATVVYQGKGWLGRYTQSNLVNVVEYSSTLIKSTYIRSTPSGAGVARKRITVVEYDSNGTTRYATTIYGYWPAGGPYAGQLKFIVKPDGVARYLAAHPAHGVLASDPGATCVLDDLTDQGVPDTTWVGDNHYASVFCKTYDGNSRLLTVSGEGEGCCGGGSGENGDYTLAYGPLDPRTPNDEWNDWKEYRRTTAPAASRRSSS